MTEKTNVIIDDDLYMDVDTSTIKSKSNNKDTANVVDISSKFDEINEQLDHIEVSIYQLEKSLTPQTASYHNAGIFVNIILGIIFALIIILLIL
ncbi:hypothetical protein [Methanosphaera cuniculi]|uniref:hypothetical protein n=1 Tax=Methanosphaera cuniculi TaxID=1077256 RepID=UPI0026EDBC31|nr:hypothetical protein [Methanosphaera cuniculi]